jgi:hypothetical protein
MLLEVKSKVLEQAQALEEKLCLINIILKVISESKMSPHWMRVRKVPRMCHVLFAWAFIFRKLGVLKMKKMYFARSRWKAYSQF